MHCHAKATASKISKNPISHKTPSQQIELIYWPRSHITVFEKLYKKVYILNFPPFFPARSALLKSKQTVKKFKILATVHEKQCSLPHWMLQHHHTFNNLNGSVKYHFNTLGTSLTIIQANVTKKLKCSTIEEDINSNLSRIVMQVNFEW